MCLLAHYIDGQLNYMPKTFCKTEKMCEEWDSFALCGNDGKCAVN